MGVWSAEVWATDYDCGLEPGTVTCSLSADGKSMTVSGNGEIKGYENNESRPWLKSVESVVIGQGVTAIGQRAFKGATKLTSVVMPGVTRLDNSAFNGTNLVSVDMPNVTTIGQSAFENVSTLTSVNMPKATSVGDKAFYHATGLTDVDMPKVETIGGQAFQGETGLTSVNMPSVTEVKYDAFQGNTSLVTVEAPNLETVGNRAFKDCSSLESLDLPSLTTVGKSAFQNATDLTEINMVNVQTIDQWAFASTGLTSVDMPNLQEIGSSAFENSSDLYYASFPSSATVGGGRLFYHTQINDGLYQEDDESRVYGSCVGYIMSGKGCVSSCGDKYKPMNGKCVSLPCTENQVYYNNECMDEYPFAKKRYTPAEAAQWIKKDDNVITIIFKK